MPLTESSKAKVSLSSLSATTAAAAENLWSKSKRLSKRRKQSVPGSSVPEVSSCNPSTNPSIQVSHTQPQIPSIQHPLGIERHEFRRKFIEGLQFYCENSSLILNSDLPADLIEFVTANGFSVESLGIILELKKSSSAFSSLVEKKPVSDTSVLGVRAPVDKRARDQNFSEISRRLLQHWMSADSCAEAFVSLSLGEEIPGLIAECASFQRILSAIPDNFHLNGKEFLSFILAQWILAVQALAYGLKDASTAEGSDSSPIKVRSQVLAIVLDRIFVRYFSDSEHFYNATVNNQFQKFAIELTGGCKDDSIGKRLVAKIFLHLSAQSASKLAKILFSSTLDDQCTSCSSLLWPTYEFLEKSTQWRFILSSIPCQVATKSRPFWLNWSDYVGKNSKYLTEIWHKTIDHWILLNKSSLVDVNALFSASLAVAALAKQVKLKTTMIEDTEERNQLIISLDVGKVSSNIVHSLESINEDKIACGMAVAQIISDFQRVLFATEEQELKKLDFGSRGELYLQLIEFYENGSLADASSTTSSKTNPRKPPIDILDSDDDADPDPVDEASNDDFPELGEDTEAMHETSIDPRILTLRSRNTKIPMYFSEIVETLLENSKKEDEQEILQTIAVLKIPVLLTGGVKIDSQMATTISRCLADFGKESWLEIPTQLALYELFLRHPSEVADVLAEIVFDKDHRALGHRLDNLSRLTQIVMMSSKQSCHNCFARLLGKHQSTILGIYPEFARKYLHLRMKIRICQECHKAGVTIVDDACAPTTTADPGQPLTWREIVDRRIAAKTRRFVAPRSKTVITVPDDYSSKLLPILWSSVANRLTRNTRFYMDRIERKKLGNIHDIFIVRTFQYLGRCLMGTSGPSCPHIRNIASHAGELVSNFSRFEDALVRRAVLSLLGVTLTVGEGKVFVIEALSVQGNILETVNELSTAELDPENKKFLSELQRCLSSYTTLGLLEDFSVGD